MADPAPPPRPPRPCPVCRKPAERGSPHRPFCSARCRQIDLGRWLSGDYAIPGEPADPEEEPG
jgi:endogenous inhibitor of DNA gyrase (YacG/DUF329 family)